MQHNEGHGIAFTFPKADLAQQREEEIQKAVLQEIETLSDAVGTALQDQDLPLQTWIVTALLGTTKQDRDKHHFFACALKEKDWMPEWMFGPMLHAAVVELDVSFNMRYIYPCRCFGRQRIQDELFRYMETGTNLEKAGGLCAYLWTLFHEDRTDPLVQAQRYYDWLLTEFLANPDIELRRTILGPFSADPEFYSPELRPLLPQAIKLAREHPDKRIRADIDIVMKRGY